jgi:hypothetical protein
VCRSELSGDKHGNMYGGAEVETAFRDRDVQTALSGAHKIPYSSAYAGKLGAGYGPDPLVWEVSCAKCLGDTGGLKRLHDVLRVVMLNRRLLCP